MWQFWIRPPEQWFARHRWEIDPPRGAHFRTTKERSAQSQGVQRFAERVDGPKCFLRGICSGMIRHGEKTPILDEWSILLESLP